MRFTNPFAGMMPETGVKSRGSKFWMIVPILLALWLGGQIAYGMILGTIVVLGLMFTVEQFPGFWLVAQNAWGRLTIAIATGWLTHKAFSSSDAIVVMVATAWATLLKAVILKFEAVRLNQERTVRLAAAGAQIRAYNAYAKDTQISR